MAVPTSGVYDFKYRVAALSEPGISSPITSDGVTQTMQATANFAADRTVTRTIYERVIGTPESYQKDAGQATYFGVTDGATAKITGALDALNLPSIRCPENHFNHKKGPPVAV